MRLCLMIEGQEGVTWSQWMALAETCERTGLEGLFRSDHYRSVDDGPALGSLDAWTTLAGVAERTERIRLGTMVSPATFRHPSVLASAANTVDHISGGRAELGLGAGWFEREHAAFGFPFAPLGERMEVFEELGRGDAALAFSLSMHNAVAAAIAGGLALAASEVIAAITAHPRPFMVGLSPMYVPHDVEGSFPSAHTSLMLAVAATLLRVQGTRAGGASLAGLALLTGWARVYLGLHFPMDIAGSVAVAALTSAPLRGDYRWVAWLRRQVERVVPFGTRATPAITGKGSAERETVGK
jgi:membrane-associated phospholipid phosphatase